MKRKLLLAKRIILYAAFLILVSCVTDLTNLSKDISLKQSVVAPIGELTININDLLSQLDLQKISTISDTINYSVIINKNLVSDTIKNIDGFLNNISSTTLKMDVLNNIPVKFTYSMKFLDANQNLIPSVINDSSYVINSAIVEKNDIRTKGTAISPTETIVNISLSASQTSQLTNANSLVFLIKVSNQDLTIPVRFTKTNYLKVKLGIWGKANFNTTMGSSK